MYTFIMVRSDETYLESFIDQIATLPHEVRRNLELMKDMDTSCSTLFEEISRLQQDYVQRVEEKIGALEVVDGKAVRVLGGESDAAVVPTTEELAAYIHEQETYNKIEAAEEDVVQRAEEKVAIAQQTYSLVENICKKLDSDLTELEKILHVRRLLLLFVGLVGVAKIDESHLISPLFVSVALRGVSGTWDSQAQ